jgi:hypothetical protein
LSILSGKHAEPYSRQEKTKTAAHQGTEEATPEEATRGLSNKGACRKQSQGQGRERECEPLQPYSRSAAGRQGTVGRRGAVGQRAAAGKRVGTEKSFEPGSEPIGGIHACRSCWKRFTRKRCVALRSRLGASFPCRLFGGSLFARRLDRSHDEGAHQEEHKHDQGPCAWRLRPGDDLKIEDQHTHRRDDGVEHCPKPHSRFFGAQMTGRPAVRSWMRNFKLIAMTTRPKDTSTAIHQIQLIAAHQ